MCKVFLEILYVLVSPRVLTNGSRVKFGASILFFIIRTERNLVFCAAHLLRKAGKLRVGQVRCLPSGSLPDQQKLRISFHGQRHAINPTNLQIWKGLHMFPCSRRLWTDGRVFHSILGTYQGQEGELG